MIRGGERIEDHNLLVLAKSRNSEVPVHRGSLTEVGVCWPHRCEVDFGANSAN